MTIVCHYRSTVVLNLAYLVRVVEKILPVEKKDIETFINTQKINTLKVRKMFKYI